MGVSWRDWANTPSPFKYFVLWPGKDLCTIWFLHSVNTLLALLFLTLYSDPQDHQKFSLSWGKGCLLFLPDPGCPNRVYSSWLFPPAYRPLLATPTITYDFSAAALTSPPLRLGKAGGFLRKQASWLKSWAPQGVRYTSLLRLASCLSHPPAVSCHISRYSAGSWLPALFLLTRKRQISVLDLSCHRYGYTLY